MHRPMTRRIRVLISGATGGVGLACAEAFAARGAELILCDGERAHLQSLATRLGAHWFVCDSVCDASIAALASQISAQFSGIDVLINAAGSGYVRSLGMVRTTRALTPLLQTGSGRRLIVNVAPAGGFTSSDGMFPYAGSEEAFQRLSRAVADQTRSHSIAVVSIVPRLTRRKATDAAGLGERIYRLERVDEPSTAAQIVSLVSTERPEWRPAPAINRPSEPSRSANGQP